MKSYWHYFRHMLFALLFGIPVGCMLGPLLLLVVFSLLGRSATIESVAETARVWPSSQLLQG
jgi:hypothetical protein